MVAYFNMDKNDYKAMRDEAGKDALKALAFFFIGVPVLIGVIVWALMN